MRVFSFSNGLASFAVVFLFSNAKINAQPTRNPKPENWVLPSQPAVALSNVALFPDTILSAQTTEMVKEGSLVEVVGASVLEQLDKDQNQKFRWFRVKTIEGKTGWIFGDGLAVGLPEERISDNLKRFYRKNVVLNAGFEQATLWLAAVEGRDNLYPNDFQNPLYDEQYLVVTNPRGRCITIRTSGASASGRTDLLLAQVQDLTGDGVAEFIIETTSFSPANTLENRDLEIYSLQTGSLTKIFDERLTLTTDDETPSPALFKSIEIEPKSLRIEYVDFVSQEKARLRQPLDWQGSSFEKALEFVTYTLEWSPKTNRFEPLYEESRIAPSGSVVQSVRLRTRPEENATVSLRIEPTDKLLVIKELEQFVVENGVKKMRPILLVKTISGVSGYVDARLIRFQKTRHGRVLEAYFQTAPLARSDWNFQFPFIKFSQPGLF